MTEEHQRWIKYNELTDESRKRIELLYPYLKVDMAVFQEKKPGVFIRHMNTGKVEKLLEPPRKNAEAPARAGSRSRRQQS